MRSARRPAAVAGVCRHRVGCTHSCWRSRRWRSRANSRACGRHRARRTGCGTSRRRSQHYWRRPTARWLEAFGNAWAKLDRFDEAIDWYERARNAPDGAASLAAVEQLANLRSRQHQPGCPGARRRPHRRYERRVERLPRPWHCWTRSFRWVRPWNGRASTGSGLQAAGDDRSRGWTPEEEAGDRENGGPLRGGRADRAEAGKRWARGRRTCSSGNEPDCRAAGTRSGHAEDVAALEPQTLQAVRHSMGAQPADFWSIVGQTELGMYASMGAGTLARDLRR